MDAQNPVVQALSKKSYKPPAPRQQLKRSIARLEASLKGTSLFQGGDVSVLPDFGYAPDPEQTQYSLECDQALLDQITPPERSQVEKNRLYKLVNDLEKDIREGMPSHEMMQRPLEEHVARQSAWDNHNTAKIQAWKAARREIDPMNDEPNFTNIEILRTAQPPTVDLRRYWQHFDEIAFRPETVAELTELTDELYFQFLQYRAQGWSQPSICKEMSWDKDQYEQAMQRLRASLPVMPESEPEAPTPEPTTEPPPSRPGLSPSWVAEQFAKRPGLTRKWVAQQAKINPTSLSRWFNGVPMAAETKMKLKGAFQKYDRLQAKATEPEPEAVGSVA